MIKFYGWGEFFLVPVYDLCANRLPTGLYWCWRYQADRVV